MFHNWYHTIFFLQILPVNLFYLYIVCQFTKLLRNHTYCFCVLRLLKKMSDKITVIFTITILRWKEKKQQSIVCYFFTKNNILVYYITKNLISAFFLDICLKKILVLLLLQHFALLNNIKTRVITFRKNLRFVLI